VVEPALLSYPQKTAKSHIFARKDRFKSLEVYGLTTIIFDKSVLLDGLKPLGLTDDQLKILTADKSHQISAGNIVLLRCFVWVVGFS
jgi:hypothetical protein